MIWGISVLKISVKLHKILFNMWVFPVARSFELLVDLPSQSSMKVFLLHLISFDLVKTYPAQCMQLILINSALVVHGRVNQQMSFKQTHKDQL